MDLPALLAECAPEVGRTTMAVIVQVESRGHPWALNDNTSGIAYFLHDAHAAATTARLLLARGHRLALGLAQVSTLHLARFGLSPETAFDPCTNLHTGAAILKEFYTRAQARFGAGEEALRHALSAYNTGSLYAGTRYVRRIFNAAPLPHAGTALDVAPAAQDAPLVQQWASWDPKDPTGHPPVHSPHITTVVAWY